jgi:hypothetical protein
MLSERIASVDPDGHEVGSVSKQEFQRSIYALCDLKETFELRETKALVPCDELLGMFRDPLFDIFRHDLDEQGAPMYGEGDEERIRESVSCELGNLRLFRVHFDRCSSTAHLLGFVSSFTMPSYLFVNGVEVMSSYVGPFLDSNDLQVGFRGGDVSVRRS